MNPNTSKEDLCTRWKIINPIIAYLITMTLAAKAIDFLIKILRQAHPSKRMFTSMSAAPTVISFVQFLFPKNQFRNNVSSGKISKNFIALSVDILRIFTLVVFHKWF